MKAKYEVFIRGWWVCPELYLRRPAESNEHTRLDRVIKCVALRGVKVNIIVFKEYKGALSNDSSYTKRALESLSPNIKVIRHPRRL